MKGLSYSRDTFPFPDGVLSLEFPPSVRNHKHQHYFDRKGEWNRFWRALTLDADKNNDMYFQY